MKTQYQPDTVSPPGESLADTLDMLGMSQTDLADRCGITEKTISQIVNGKAPITEGTALALERVLGTTARFWLAREARYREFLARAEEVVIKESHADWARVFPYKKMADLGWVEAASQAGDKALNLLKFYGVSDKDCWKNLWECPQAAFRQTTRSGKKTEVISAWLRQGELEAQKLQLPKYDESGFKEVITSLRECTTEENPSRFMQVIRERCADVGVKFLVVRELPSLGVYGVTRWLAGAPVIQQSLLLKSHDHFWFTFFHEAKHVLQKVKKGVFLEGQGLENEDQKREDEANRFSGDLLIPPKEYTEFAERGKFSHGAIMEFAKEINTHPGIVVGRLMREKKLEYGNPTQRMQVRLKWAD